MSTKVERVCDLCFRTLGDRFFSVRLKLWERFKRMPPALSADEYFRRERDICCDCVSLLQSEVFRASVETARRKKP